MAANLKTPKLSCQAKMAAARLTLLKRAPYFRGALMRLVFRETPGLGTFATTERGICVFDPHVVDIWTVEQIAAVLLHELEHLRRNHHKRGRNIKADPRVFNIAGDMEINDDLADGGWKLPGNPCLPEQIGAPNGRLAEEYYHECKKQQNEQQGQQGQQGQGQGEGEGQDGQGQGQGQPGTGGGWCGGCAGNPVKGEPTGEAETGGMSEAQQAQVWREVAESVRQEAQKGRGSVPGFLRVWAEETLSPPKVRWQDKLARLARQSIAYKAGNVDYRYDRPSRRQSAIGYGPGKPILPAMRAPIPKVALALDTSGSMGTKELTEALSEAQGIIKAVGAEVEFVCCDAQVHGGVQRVSNVKDLISKMKGGGGTSFVPVFEEFAKRAHKPNVLIFLTDGDGTAPASPPKGINTIWLLVGPYKRKPCEWGQHIMVEE